MTNNIDAIAIQHGGDHYDKDGIQPVEYIHANNLNFFEGNVVKYTTRHRKKNGAEDMKKALHYCQMVLQLEYGIHTDISFKGTKTLGELRD